MKMKILLFCLIISTFCCSSENKLNYKTTKQVERDSIIRPLHISENAWLINIGFIDKPVFNWVEFIGNYQDIDGKIYSHIYQFRYFDELGNDPNTLSYEWNKARNNKVNLKITNFEGFTFNQFPGEGTLLLKNDEQEITLINVMEFHEFDRTFRGIPYFGIPIAQIDSMYLENGIVYTGDTKINLEQTKKGEYKVRLLDDKGVRAIMFKMNESCMEIPTKISYLNTENGHINFIEKGCYLELLDESDLSEI